MNFPNKEEFRQRWVDALRSGEYTQCTDYLVDDGNYCCIGVACDLLGLETTLDIVPLTDGMEKLHYVMPEGHSEVCLPTGSLAGFLGDVAGGLLVDLSALNDSGETFSHIAKVIEARVAEEKRQANSQRALEKL